MVEQDDERGPPAGEMSQERPGAVATADEVRDAARRAVEASDVALAAQEVGIKVLQEAVMAAKEDWHTPRVAPTTGSVIEQSEDVAQTVGQATHVREVARREYKNLARQFQAAWREDGPLRSRSGPAWGYAAAEGIPPLASAGPGVMEADPARMAPVDDGQPTHDCDVSQQWRSWVQGHAET